MCISKETSIISFILGTIINISVMLYFKKETIYTICIVWQWILMMQLAEYFIWSDKNCGKTNRLGTKMALFFNITQPLVVYLAAICVSKVSLTPKIIASIAVLFYISYMIIKLNNNQEYTCIKPSKNCTGLNLKWWGDIDKAGKIYCIILAIIILCLYRPLNLSIFILFFIFVALFISNIFYSCNQPSMWCWLVVSYPIFLSIFYKLYLKE
jgi:hypothetical protein